MVPSTQCGPNRTTLCWRVYVDTLGPAVECDSVFFACESLEVPIYVHDDVAVMRESTAVVLDGAEYLYPDGMRFEGDTLIFAPGVVPADGDTFEIEVFAQDIFGNEGESCAWQIVVDRTPPTVSFAPADGGTLDVPQPTIVVCAGDPAAAQVQGKVAAKLDPEPKKHAC